MSRLRRQEHVDKIRVIVDSDFAGDPVSRKSTTGLVAQIGSHTVKSGSTLQSLTALSVGEAEFYAVVKGRSSWTGFEIHIPGSGSSNEGWITQWQLYGKFFGGSIGSRTQNEKTHWYTFFLGTRTSSRRRPQKSLQDWYSTDHGFHTEFFFFNLISLDWLEAFHSINLKLILFAFSKMKNMELNVYHIISINFIACTLILNKII